MWSISIYPFVIRSHVNQLLEKINQPQCLQNYSTAMLHNHTKVVIELQHGFQFIFFIYVAKSFGVLKKFVELHVIDFTCHQCFNNFLEVEPPKKDNIVQITYKLRLSLVGRCKLDQIVRPRRTPILGVVNTGPKRSQKNVTQSSISLTVKWKVSLSFANSLNFIYNRPFAGSGHMVRNILHWDANNAAGLPKQRISHQSSPTFLCFESPTASFASQCNLFRTM